MRIALLVAAALLAGCGNGMTSSPSLDLAQPTVDLATSGGTGGSCGVDNVQQACGGSCAACLYFGGGGLCVKPCSTSQPSSCPSGQTCHATTSGGDGGAIPVQIVGACAGIDGYCA